MALNDYPKLKLKADWVREAQADLEAYLASQAIPRGWPTVKDITFDTRIMDPDENKVTELDVMLDLHTAGIISTQDVIVSLERTMAINLTPGEEERRRTPVPPLSRAELDRQNAARHGPQQRLTLDLNHYRQLASIPPLAGTAAEPLQDVVRTYIPRANQQLAADAIERALRSGAASIELTPFLRPLPPSPPPAITTNTARRPAGLPPPPATQSPPASSLHRQRRLTREK